VQLIELQYKSRKITAISDTHGHHRELIIPDADFLIHCGDACTDGNEEELNDFFRWFSAQQARNKIFVAGNHDLVFDLEPERASRLVPHNVVYLESQYTLIDGISFYSAPARPWLHESPEERRMIDFLLTHGPSYSILDMNLGCRKLLSFVQQQQPVYQLFGHIHQMAQQSISKSNTHFINVSMNGI